MPGEAAACWKLSDSGASQSPPLQESSALGQLLAAVLDRHQGMAGLQCPWCVSMPGTKKREGGTATWAGGRPTISGTMPTQLCDFDSESNTIKSFSLQEPHIEQWRKRVLCRTLVREHTRNRKRKNPSFCSIPPDPLLTMFNILPGGKGEMSIRPISIITEQAVRVHLEQRSKELTISTLTIFSFLDFLVLFIVCCSYSFIYLIIYILYIV